MFFFLFFLFACVCVRVSLCVGTCVCTHIWKSKVEAGNHPQLLFILFKEAEPIVQTQCSLSWLVNSQLALSIPALPVKARITVGFQAPPCVYWGSGDLNARPHTSVCAAITFTPESSLHPCNTTFQKHVLCSK